MGADNTTLSPEDRHRVLIEWNRTKMPYPRTSCLHHRFEMQAAATPHAEALVVGERRFTYRELNERANRVAHRLQKGGVGPETLVGIFLTRSADLVCALLGVLKAGGAYVPMDPVYPADRVSFMLRDSKVHTVLTEASLTNTLSNYATTCGHMPAIVCLDTDPQVAASSPENPVGRVNATNLAYVIYTSGSTGRPKSVGLEHRNAVSFVHWAGRLYSPRELSGVAACTSICFDPSILELFVPLSFGGKVILAENALALPELPAANEIHLMDTVPSAVRELLRIGGLPTSLETINLGGEPVSDDLVRQLYALPHIKRVYDQYGPTETTTTATCALRSPDEPGTIGRPIANTQVYLLNENLEPVALGATGELCIGGAGVARGYLNSPELTEKKFISDPFSLEPGARLYRSGDLCRYRMDGQLEYVGRLDQQVKIHGFRVELGEIESVLRTHPAIDEAVVVMREDSPGRATLAAYVVPQTPPTSIPPEPLTANELRLISSLRAYLRDRLPYYMVPAFFVLLGSFTLMSSGKIDRKALPAPLRSRSTERSHSYRAPRNTSEETIGKIWSELLGVDKVSIHDNFFDVGGDSLIGVSMLSEVEKATGRKLPHDTILKAPTVAKLAAIADGKTPANDDDSILVGVQTQGNRPRLFLVHGIGGGMLWGYANLSRHLGTDQPVYVFKAPELESNTASASIAAMAERYVDELRRFQPEGPYCLGGYCFGGNIAYEMARLLEAQGQSVALLALFNCWPSSSSYDHFRWTPVHLAKFGVNLCFWMGRFLKWEAHTRRDFVQWKFRTLKRKLAACFRLMPAHTGVDVDAQVDVAGLSEAEKRLWREHTKAIAEHQTGPYNGHVTLFRTRGHPLFCSFDHHCGWTEIVRGGVTVKIIPGQHETLMVEPHVGRLAQALQTDLAAVTRPAALLLTVILGVTSMFRGAPESSVVPTIDEFASHQRTSRTLDPEVVSGDRSRPPTRRATVRLRPV
jgi:amino acid adenylation domain-containing protein